MQLRELIAHAAKKFEEVGIDSAQIDAELIAAFVLGKSRGELQSALITDLEISEAQGASLVELYGRRLQREPLQHITGIAYFRNLELEVGPGVFVPRPETEVVAQLAIDALRADGASEPIAVDLGTGSGAIALSMKYEVPNARVFAVEISEAAHTYTVRNFTRYKGAELSLGDLADCFNALNGSVSVVVSNPPYIPDAMVPIDPEVHLHDPALALYGGPDGLAVIRVVIQTARRLLRSGGQLIIEHAENQSEAVRELLLADGWRQVRATKDLTGRDRAVTAIA